jgi:hypothetical protein
VGGESETERGKMDGTGGLQEVQSAFLLPSNRLVRVADGARHGGGRHGRAGGLTTVLSWHRGKGGPCQWEDVNNFQAVMCGSDAAMGEIGRRMPIR